MNDYLNAIKRENHTGTQPANSIGSGEVSDSVFGYIKNLSSDAQAQIDAVETIALAANGQQGAQGVPGEQGIQGIPGEQGIQGVPGTNGTNGTNGAAVAIAAPMPNGGTRLLGVPGVNWISTTTRGVPATRYYFTPFSCVVAAHINALFCEVTTAANFDSCRIGIYNANTNWQPTTLITDSGLIQTNMAGPRSVAQNLDLGAGNYLLCFVCEGQDAQFRTMRAAPGPAGLMRTLGASPFVSEWWSAGSANALPATAGSISWTNTTASANAGMDHFAFLDWSA
jgi:hypothetical protein